MTNLHHISLNKALYLHNSELPIELAN